MPVYESIAQIMQGSAAKAVELASDRFGFSLDYSESSFEPLETILTNVAASLADAASSVSENNPSSSPTPNSDKAEYETKLWGSYFGEVIRQRWDGHWELSLYPGTSLTVPSVSIHGAQLYPLMKVYRRLTLGDAENLWLYYQKIRQKLSNVLPIDGHS